MNLNFFSPYKILLILIFQTCLNLFAIEIKTAYHYLEINDNSIFLVKNKKNNFDAKIAKNIFNQNTYGGVTESYQDLIDFFIDIKSNDKNLKIVIKPNQKKVCSELKFNIINSKIKMIPTKYELNSAVNCEYEVLKPKDDKVFEFKLLFNHTFKHWCTSEKESDAKFTALKISEDCTIKDPSQIYSINLNSSSIKDISPVSGFLNLKYLILGHNNIEKLTNGILDKLVNLNWLWLMHNQLKEISSEVFKNLEKLDWLSLYNNQISFISPYAFKNLKNLQGIELSNNLLKTYPIGLMDSINLISIEMDSNEIESVPENAFKNLPLLTNISIANNKIKNIPENLFANNNNLYFVNLSNNIISNLHEKTKSDLKKVENVNLFGNSLKLR
ncbi:MAG: hypothetical protein DCC88_08155 [Spirobacillus cienkowskii]|uniref:Leucine-rich repeat domain-containing protein n=1 Tax=Spirobacillus cienkowskii TaxID=495820 RepID=A0A369KSW7_9BACT|nr:MAG: hypothetical protein DCC88_08155 [Spirobacillus cienkowskii]